MNGHQQPSRTAEPDRQRPEDLWTVGRLLTWTTDYLKRRGSESPRLDAEVMLAHVLDWQRVQLYTHFEDEVERMPRGGFASWSAAASEGRRWPISWAARSFIRSHSTVSPAVLIPRPESEFVVVEYLEQTQSLESPRAVDVGTGSGCLAIASAHRQPGAHFVAIDISEEALAVARRNAAQHRRP